MLTAKPIKSANHALHYYKEDNYYLKEQGLGNAWWGKGAEALGLSGEVSTEQFNALINGKLPSGQQLGKKVEGGIAHRPGFDLTFSAPKSVSILALLGYDKRLLEAHHLAVKKTLSVIEQYAAQARVSHKGSGISYENTHNLVAALINHTVSREQDPQLHTHAVIFNMTQRQDGHWRALASRGNERGAGLEGFLERVYANTLHFGQYYRGELALQIRKLGYEIELSGKNACFEIKGVPIEVKTLFSSRRSQIESALAEKGLSGSKASSIATLDTRKAKESIDANTLESTWKDKAQGFDALLQTLYQDSEKNAHTKTPISASELRHLAKDAVLLATFSLTERESVFSETALFDKAWHQVFGLVSGEDLKGAIVQAKKDKVLLPTAYTLHGQPALTTPPAIALEKATLEEWRVSQGLFLPLVDIHKNPFEEKLSTLTKGQAQAATLILTNKDAVVGIQGYAGTGKTTLLKTVKAILDETQTLEKNNPSSFYRLHGLGPSTTAMQVLGKEVGISTQTVASFLKELERDPHQMTLGGALKTERQQHFNRHFEGLVETLDTVIQKKAAMTPEKEQEIAQQLGHLLMPPPLSKTVFILDEASFVSTRDMYALLKGINKLGARVVLLGDTLQLGAIEAGKPFAELQRAGMQKAVMQDILRQPKGSLLREAIYSTIDNDLGRAFQLLENHIVVTGTEKTPENINETTTPSKGEKTPQSRIGQIADHYLKLSEKEQAATLLLTASNVDRDALNTVVRKAFQHQGRIGPDNHPVYQLEPLNFTRIERMWAQNYPLHSIVRFNRAHRGLGIAKGSYWQVAENHPEQNRLVLRHGGRAIEWLPHLESGQYSGHVEVYEQKRRDLSVGEVLRWRRNDRDLPLANGQSCQVKSIDNDKSTLTLSVLETPGFNLASPQKREVILDLNATQSQHWSYGYVDTVHSAQGKTVDRVLALAQSYNVNLSTCRSFYVAISRARKEAWLYTDNIERYREQISSHLGEKTSALASGLREEWVPKPEVKEQARQERIGEEKEGLSSVVEKEKAPSAETRLKSEREQTTPDYRLQREAVLKALESQAEQIAGSILGEPNRRYSTAQQLRFGKNKGSICVTLSGEKRGLWYDFSSGEGGNLLTLIAREYGVDHKEALRIGTELSGQSLAVSVKAKGKTDKKIKAIKENTDAQMKQKKVKELLKQSRPITGTLAETYLRKHRRIPGDLPSTLRFHRALFHPFLKESYPALLVPATDFLRNTQGVQAIFLNPKTGQKLSQLPSKISMGNIKGQHAKVTHSQEGKVAIAEGPETALSIAKASPHWQVYCVFGAFNFEHFKVKALEKKDGVPKEIVLCADNDGMNPGVIKSLTRAAFSFQQAGFSTTMTMPKEKGYDFNDILKKEGVEAVSQVLNQEVKVPPLTLLSEPQRLQVMQKLIQSLSPDEGKERAADNLKPPRIEAVLGNKPAEKTDSFREESQRVSRIISGKTGLEKTSNLPQKIHEDREREL